MHFSFDIRWGQGDNDLFLFYCRCVKRLWKLLQCCHSSEEKSFPLPSVLAYAHTKSTLRLKGREKLHSVAVWHDSGFSHVFYHPWPLRNSIFSDIRRNSSDYNQTCSVLDSSTHLLLMLNRHFSFELPSSEV